jgi:hypothetical protein
MSSEFIEYILNRFKVLLILLLILFTRFDLFAQTSEYEMKAVAFEKLSLFIDWPPHAFESTNDEFIIAVLGYNPFGSILDDIYLNRKIKNRAVKVIYIKDIRQLKECHLLFISKIEKSELQKVLEQVRAKPVLTIVDAEGFAMAGCFIDFYDYEGKLRFEINQKAMESSGFTLDYRLLRVSKIVNSSIE